MKAYRLAVAGLALGLLTGCASLLERSYTTSEPHSSKFWESEAAATAAITRNLRWRYITLVKTAYLQLQLTRKMPRSVKRI